MRDRPWFLWDTKVNDAQFRELLRHPDPRVRAQWQGKLLREACFVEVWRYVTLEEVVRDWDQLVIHMGRKREFWEYLLRSWRQDGLLAA